MDGLKAVPFKDFGFFRKLFSPCHCRIWTKFESTKAQGLKPHSLYGLYGTTKVVP